jgi:hypothetical protein
MLARIICLIDTIIMMIMLVMIIVQRSCYLRHTLSSVVAQCMNAHTHIEPVDGRDPSSTHPLRARSYP